MFAKSESEEVKRVMGPLLDNLSATVHAQMGILGADLRRQIGKVRANYFEMIADGTFASELLACFTKAHEAGAELQRFAYVRKQLIVETSDAVIASGIIQTAINFCLATEARIVTAMTFVSRDDVEDMMRKVSTAFAEARDKAADDIDSASYQQLTYLGGALINHLATTSRPLPRMITFKLGATFSSLAASMRFYYVADRAEELAAENKTVHPLFMQRDLRGLNR